MRTGGSGPTTKAKKTLRVLDYIASHMASVESEEWSVELASRDFGLFKIRGM
jgi:hypothetical protein